MRSKRRSFLRVASYFDPVFLYNVMTRVRGDHEESPARTELIVPIGRKLSDVRTEKFPRFLRQHLFNESRWNFRVYIKMSLSSTDGILD
jgi:hypothetical protein